MLSQVEPHTFSASQIATYRLCPRKWFLQSIKGIKSDPGPSAALGTEIHAQLEKWFTRREVPTHAAARRLLPLLPLPTDGLLVEHEFRILLPVAPFRGFIDLLVPDPKGVKGLVFDDIPNVLDHKSISNLRYAKNDDDLRTDPQAVLYGIAARLAVASKVSDVPEVGLCWNYTATRGKGDTARAKLRQTLTILEDGIAPILDEARTALSYREASVDDVPGDTKGCDAFGGCPFRNDCSWYASNPRPSLLDALDTKENPMEPSDDLLARLRAASKRVDPEPPAAPAPAADTAVKPSPEPTLQPFDTSGLDVPPPAPIAINPPDAAPNLTPETAPAAKGKRGTKKSDVDALIEEALIRALQSDRIADANILFSMRRGA